VPIKRRVVGFVDLEGIVIKPYKQSGPPQGFVLGRKPDRMARTESVFQPIFIVPGAVRGNGLMGMDPGIRDARSKSAVFWAGNVGIRGPVGGRGEQVRAVWVTVCPLFGLKLL